MILLNSELFILDEHRLCRTFCNCPNPKVEESVITVKCVIFMMVICFWCVTDGLVSSCWLWRRWCTWCLWVPWRLGLVSIMAWNEVFLCALRYILIQARLLAPKSIPKPTIFRTVLLFCPKLESGRKFHAESEKQTHGYLLIFCKIIQWAQPH